MRNLLTHATTHTPAVFRRLLPFSIMQTQLMADHKHIFDWIKALYTSPLVWNPADDLPLSGIAAPSPQYPVCQGDGHMSETGRDPDR